MKIVCNGKEMTVAEGLAVESLLLELELNPATVVVECDSKIILRDDYETTILKEGSVVELIKFVGGG
ncbi:MAG: sulfur carrier protein ThiS [Thermodesulfobacteriota bacterium]